MNPPLVYIPDGNSSSTQINLPDGPVLIEAVDPPYCALCLRERPPGGQFYHYSSAGANAVEFQQTMQSVAGVELNVEDDFDICTPCWKMIQLMVDFRLCCCKAQDWIGRGHGGRGIKASDEWFYEETGLIIENLRSSIREHVLVIEGEELSGEDQMQAETISEEEDESLVDQVDVSEGLITQISVGDFKIEVFDDVDQEVVESTASLVDINRCETCNRCFASKQDLDVHIQICKPQSETNNGQSNAGQWQICSLCNAKLANKRTLRSHMNSVHGEKKHHCEYCGSKFARA